MFVKERNKIPLPTQNIQIRLALVYPNLYEMGMSSYTVHLLYSLFNSYPGIRCERFFIPNKKDTVNSMKSMDSGSNLADFDVIAFTIHYELDYENVLWVLDTLHIPYFGNNRQENNYPLIIAGGSAVKSNPLLLLPFMDLLVFGDLEPVFENLCQSLVKIFENNQNFHDFINKPNLKILQDSCFLPNVIICKYALQHLSSENTEYSLFPVNRKHLGNLDESICPIRQILPQFQSSEDNLVFGETFLLEINRGCPSGCRFCLTGYINRPFRNRSFSQIKHIIDESIKNTGAKKITLIGSAVADHPNFLEICQYIVDKGLQIMIPSIRIDRITPEILSILRRGRVKSLAIAPETGSDVLRRTLNKGICNSDVVEKCKWIFTEGFHSIKLYFLIGVPFETPDDILAIVDLVKNIILKSGTSIPKNGIRLSINPFIPKLFTPYNGYTFHFIDKKMQYIRNTEKFLQSELKKLPNVECEFLNWKESRLQAILSQLDETFAPLLVEFYENGALPVTMNILDKQKGNIVTKFLQDTFDTFTISQSTEWSSYSESIQMKKLQKIINTGFRNGYLLHELKSAKSGKLFSCEVDCNHCGIC